jgi:hypothetical protein
VAVQPSLSFKIICCLGLAFGLGFNAACGGTSTPGGTGPPGGTGSATAPVFVTESHSATDGAGAQFNSATLSINVSGNNPILIAAWHAEFDGGNPDGWVVQDNGLAGTEIVDTNGYTGGDGNRRFRIYYWLSPSQGTNTVTVSLPYTGPNELAVSVILLNNVSQTSPLGTPVLDVSTASRTGESETVPTTTSDLVVHVIADALVTRGTLGGGETSVSVVNDGHHAPFGDASLWISTKPQNAGSTTVSSSGWASSVINGAGIAVHGAT